MVGFSAIPLKNSKKIMETLAENDFLVYNVTEVLENGKIIRNKNK